MSDAPRNYLIVGGGTAGAVLASRLSEDKSCHVTLVEAGGDMPPGTEPASILDPFPRSYGDPQFAWPGLVAETGAKLNDGKVRASRQFVQGKIMGGSSSIMGMMASRGSPDDYDDWASHGASGWGWNDVLPYFRKLERDLDFGGPMHGKSGPIVIRRHQPDQWPPFAKAVAAAMERRGFRYIPDYNGEFGEGYSPLPMNNLPDRRSSVATDYLGAEVRARDNLSINADSTVKRLLIDGGVVKGVEIVNDAGIEHLAAAETIVCAGAIHSPAILMRSGIGPAEDLRRAGIPVLLDRSGVGANLLNHIIVHLAVYLPERSRQSRALHAMHNNILRFSSNMPGAPANDLHIFPVNKTSWHPLGRHVGALGAGLRKPFSSGTVTLAANPLDPPKIRFNILDDDRDLERMIKALGIGCELLLDPAVVNASQEVFLPMGGQANKLNRPGLGNYFLSLAIASIFAMSTSLRRGLLRDYLIDPRDLLNDLSALRNIVLRHAAPVHHPCGTCRMGQPDDLGAVVDPSCRVIGISGVRVVDASIMPTMISGNPHLPVIMMAEKAADMIRAGQ